MGPGRHLLALRVIRLGRVLFLVPSLKQCKEFIVVIITMMMTLLMVMMMSNYIVFDRVHKAFSYTVTGKALRALTFILVELNGNNQRQVQKENSKKVKWSQLETTATQPVWPLYLHGVIGVLIIKDQGLLDELMVPFQLVDVVLVVNNVVLILLQLVHLVFQGPCDLDGAPGNLLVEARTGQELASKETTQKLSFLTMLQKLCQP